MGESRLIEITSNIKSMDGPLSVMAYIMSLSENDISLFLQCVGNSKYRNMNLVSAVFAFAEDYLKSKNLLDEGSSLSLEPKGSSAYLEQLFDSDVKKRK